MLRAASVAFLLIGVSAAAFAQQAPQSAAPAASLTPGSVVLLAGRDDPEAIDVLKRALRDSDPQVRATAARVVAVSLSPQLTNDLVGALAREQVTPVGAELVRALLLHGGESALPVVNVQIKRIGGAAVIAAAEWMARMKPDMLAARLPELVSIAGMSPAFGRVIEGAVRQHPDQRESLRRAWKAIAPEDTWGTLFEDKRPADEYTAETLPRTLPFLLPSTLDAAGCRLGKDSYAVAVTKFAVDGRPSHIDLDVSTVPKPCVAVVSALARTRFIDPDEPVLSGASQTFLLPMTAAFSACEAGETWPSDEVVPVRPPSELQSSSEREPSSSKVDRPTKIHDVHPIYPMEAQHRRIQGLVVVEAEITRTGCVSTARILRSIPLLDLASLWAVMGWEYAPTVFEGQPVPVIMTVTVNFTLR